MAEGDAKNEAALASKLSDLESMMKSLHLSLMDERLRVNRECDGQGEPPPGDWASLNRLHLPQCPVVRSGPAVTCPLHGASKTTTARLPSVASDRRDRMEKLRQIYDDSAFSPDFRSRTREAQAEPRRERVIKLPRREDAVQARPEEESTASLCSSDAAAADEAADGEPTDASSQDNASDLFNPFEAIQSVHKRFLEFEHFVQTAAAATNSLSQSS